MAHGYIKQKIHNKTHVFGFRHFHDSAEGWMTTLRKKSSLSEYDIIQAILFLFFTSTISKHLYLKYTPRTVIAQGPGMPEIPKPKCYASVVYCCGYL